MSNDLRPLAVIREDECIGCTQCIDACPVDAIIGSENLMHTVISEECIGCKLCISPCPVDCIDLIQPPDNYQQKPKAFITARAKAKKARNPLFVLDKIVTSESDSLQATKDYIANALKRAKKR